ncbi:probable long-chain-alcohol O-fatty-acyltransferase 1 [Aegilops tauschii subsp. strangulata]|uniref:Wax synthase domain-containing protein n=3 Tax=Triticinae TaxID=1648030 RepID=A0A453R5E6_AEGTS|nr:probable long-chain-alcohol O-fatty-acyltransferase 1 [Aegilops tauschii subsp. strangulata]XP_044439353.1 probable long-chain-alcohol O-fatty-acyltransferase 1 [Triticum aestivum]
MAAALMDGELGSLLKATAAVWAAMYYARMAAALIRPGAARLAALLPAVALFCAIPFAFSTTTFRGSSAFFLCWLGTFKLLLLAAGRGPLDPSLSLPHFVFSASLPVKFRQPAPAKSKDQDPASASARGHGPAKILVAGAVIPFIIYAYQFKDAMRRWQLVLLYTVHIYLSLELLLGSVRALIHGVLGMEMEPQVDRPYLASSLRDFWGRRWNLMVPAILRPSVHGPVRARFGDAAGVMASFLVSGLMHEVMFYYIMWQPPSGDVTAFFVLHGACTAAEGWWARHAGWWRPPRAAAVPLTLAFVGGTGIWLFFPAMVRGGLDELVLQECQGLVAAMEQAGRWLAGGAAAGPILSTR